MYDLSKKALVCLGLLAACPVVQADTPCGSCGSCCPRVVKIKKNIGFGGAEPPRGIVVSSTAAMNVQVPSLRLVMTDSGSRELTSRDMETRSTSSCAGSSADLKRILASIEQLADQQKDLAQQTEKMAKQIKTTSDSVDEITQRLIAVEKKPK